MLLQSYHRKKKQFSRQFILLHVNSGIRTFSFAFVNKRHKNIQQTRTADDRTLVVIMVNCVFDQNNARERLHGINKICSNHPLLPSSTALKPRRPLIKTATCYVYFPLQGSKIKAGVKMYTIN